MKFLDADTRLAEKSAAKILIVGPSGVGKTSLLRTLTPEQLASTLVVDIEAGLIAVSDLQFASVRPRTWQECRDLACVLGGPNPALPANVAYSEAHYNDVMKNPELARLTGFTTLFIDSMSAGGRLCFTHSEQQPEAFTDRGRKDLRAIYGLHARSMLGWLNQLQHARERTVIFVAVLERNTDELNISTWQPQIEGAKTGRELPAIVDEIITMTWVDFGDRKPVRAPSPSGKNQSLLRQRPRRKTRACSATYCPCSKPRPASMRQAAGMACKVLDGARVAELPAERPTRFQLVANLRTAKLFGITLPPSILLRADEVIE